MGQFIEKFTFDRNALKRTEVESADVVMSSLEEIERGQQLNKAESNIVGALANYMGLLTKEDGIYKTTELASDFKRLYSLEPADAWRWLLTRSLWKYVVPNGTNATVNRVARASGISFQYFPLVLGLLVHLQAFPGKERYLYFSELCVLLDNDANWALSSHDLLQLLLQLRSIPGYAAEPRRLLGDLEDKFNIPRDNLNTILGKAFKQTGLFQYHRHDGQVVAIAVATNLSVALQARIRHVLDNPLPPVGDTVEWHESLSGRDNDMPVEVAYVAAESDDSLPDDQPEDETQPTFTLDDFEEQTGFPRELLERWKRHLDRRMHVVFQGPPGTGKTFVATKLAQFVVSQTKGFWEVVQFHPAYSYEDFMRGIRPTVDEQGHLTYEPQDGRFLEFCRKARAREQQSAPCVLIIDELNRANLSRVFGEMMYLLEYRAREIPLAYGGQPFRIPRNVYIIGTMNTADRSIALVDHALRRRFSFIRLRPEYTILQKHLESDPVRAQALVSVLQKVNRTIDLDDYEIGISFFLSTPADELAQCLPDIWQTEIEPYLEEFFYDDPAKVSPFRWEQLKDQELSSWRVPAQGGLPAEDV